MGKRFVNIGYSYNARFDWYFFPTETRGISGTIHSFVMIQNNISKHFNARHTLQAEMGNDRFDHLQPFFRVLGHEGEFVLI